MNLVPVSAPRLVDALVAYYFTRQAVMIHGRPGVGKSQIVKQVAKILGIEYRDVRLTLLDEVDLRGLPSIEDGMTTWKTPDFLASIDPQSKGILHLDEFNSARPPVQAACYSLLLDRRLGDWTMPDGWQVVACGNRAQDRAFVHQMSSANADRMIHFDLEVDDDAWQDHALEAGFHLCVTTYLQAKPTFLNDFDPTRRRNATPRKWEKMSDLLFAFEKMGAHLTKKIASDLIHAALPKHIADDFFTYWSLFSSIPLISEIENDPLGAPLPDTMSARFATSAALASRTIAKASDPARARKMFSQHMKYLDRGQREFKRLYVTLITQKSPSHPALETEAYIRYEVDASKRTHRAA